MWRAKTAMKPKSRTFAMQVIDLTEVSLLTVHSLSRRFALLQEESPSEMCTIFKGLDEIGVHLQSLSNQLEALMIVDSRLLGEGGHPASLNKLEITRLLQLNRQLSELEHFFVSIMQEAELAMKAKVSNAKDPMEDYEIELKIDYVLREDDPEYEEDDDNYLTSRSLVLENLLKEKDEEGKIIDWAESFAPEFLHTEPHCWLFHDLYDHSYGPESPSLSFENCARIGKIFVEVQIRQQYEIDLGK